MFRGHLRTAQTTNRVGVERAAHVLEGVPSRALALRLCMLIRNTPKYGSVVGLQPCNKRSMINLLAQLGLDEALRSS